MAVRPATEADAEAVATVHVRTWQDAYGHVFPAAELAALEVPARAERWRATLAGGGRVLVGGDPVAGFVAFGPARDAPAAGEVHAIYVLPERWGTGLARELLAAAETALRDAGYAEAVLWVLEDNPRARRFYASAGWDEDGGERRSVHLGTTVPELRCRKSL